MKINHPCRQICQSHASYDPTNNGKIKIIRVDVSPIKNGDFAFVMLVYWSVVVNVILSKYKTPSKPYKAPQFVSGGITRDSNLLARVRGPYYDSCFLQ